MAAEGRANDDTGGKSFEQCRIIAPWEWREVARRIDQLVAKARCALARLAGPEPIAACLGSAGRQPFGRLDMRHHQAGEGHSTGIEQLGQSAKAGFQPSDKTA